MPSTIFRTLRRRKDFSARLKMAGGPAESTPSVWISDDCLPRSNRSQTNDRHRPVESYWSAQTLCQAASIATSRTASARVRHGSNAGGGRHGDCGRDAAGDADLYYDPCAFYDAAARIFGDEGRNYLRGPGFDNLNFSLVKDTAVGFLGEGGKVEFRAEFFNLFNHTNFALPASGATAYAGTCGGANCSRACTLSVVNPTARRERSPRRMELRAKFNLG